MSRSGCLKRFEIWPHGLRCFGITCCALLSLWVGSAWADDTDTETGFYTPTVATQDIREAAIDTEDFELGSFLGLISVEDFELGALGGVRVAYHANEIVFLEASAARSSAVDTAFERLSGSVQLIPEGENHIVYYQLSVGVNALPGEFFWRGRRAWNMACYALGGVGVTTFAGDNYFTVHGGLGWRWLLNDWFAVNTTVQVQTYETDILGEANTTVNLSWLGGVSFFF
ncbi:MAG: outer membrane beta-barrel domain-containing protein [Gammaproteobacteria bacterium]